MGEKTEAKIKLDEIKKVLKLRDELEALIMNKILVFEQETGMTVDKVNITRIKRLGNEPNKLYTDLNIML